MDAPRFIADSNVGRLARWLRILGYDVAYDAAIEDGALVRQSVDEERIILTRDTGVVQRKLARRCIFVRDDAVDDQLRQVIAEAGLRPDPERFWTRCPLDNAEIHPADRDQVAGRVPPYTYRTQTHFAECPQCGRVYWRGSHLDRFLRRLQDILPA